MSCLMRSEQREGLELRLCDDEGMLVVVRKGLGPENFRDLNSE